MSAISENIPVSWITPEQLKQRLEIACKFEFLGGAHRRYCTHELYDSKVIGYASTFFAKSPRQITYWYTALEDLSLLTPCVPTLPENFFEIYFGNCPIMEMEGKLKRDQTHYKLYETHSLFLIPPISLNDFEHRLKIYFRKEFIPQQSCLPQFDLYQYVDENKYDLITSNHWEWVLIPHEVLEKSRGKTFSDRLQGIKTLNERITEGPNYHVGTLTQMTMFHCLYRVATGAFLDQSLTLPRNYRPEAQAVVQEIGTSPLFTHLGIKVQEAGSGACLVIFVNNYLDYDNPNKLGISILRNFSELPAEDWVSELGTRTSCSCLIS